MNKAQANISFEKCLELMKDSDPQKQEDGFHFLAKQASNFTSEIILAFEQETDHGLRCWLLELLGEVRDHRATKLLKREVLGTDERFKSWALRGLKEIDTKETRTFLYQNKL